MRYFNAMTTSPNAVSLAALVLSALSLVVSFLAFRSGGPIVRATAYFLKTRDGHLVFIVDVANNGRADITIDIEHVSYLSFYTSTPKDRKFELELSGPPLPYRLPGHSFEHWQAPGDDLDNVLTTTRAGSVALILRVGRRRRKVGLPLQDAADTEPRFKIRE
jgi:hypothetical protein